MSLHYMSMHKMAMQLFINHGSVCGIDGQWARIAVEQQPEGEFIFFFTQSPQQQQGARGCQTKGEQRNRKGGWGTPAAQLHPASSNSELQPAATASSYAAAAAAANNSTGNHGARPLLNQVDHKISIHPDIQHPLYRTSVKKCWIRT